MKKKSTEDSAMPEMTFEQAFAELENLVGRMDAGQLSLDEMIKYYEQGRKLADFCREKLNGFEKKIQLLSNINAFLVNIRAEFLLLCQHLWALRREKSARHRRISVSSQPCVWRSRQPCESSSSR